MANQESKSARMIAMYNDGMEISAIAKELGVRYNFVYNVVSTRCMKEGTEVRTTRKQGEKKAAIVKMLEQGKTLKEISQETGCFYNYCFKIRKEWEATQKAVQEA